MLATLTLTLTLAAPVPAVPPPPPPGTPPQLVELKADADGKVRLLVNRPQKVRIVPGAAPVPPPPLPNAQPVPADVARPAVVERQVVGPQPVEIDDIKDLVVTTADGRKLTPEEALPRLTPGTIVVVTGDGKPVSPAYLKLFKDDVLVLVSPELANPASPSAGRPLPNFPVGRPLPQPPVRIEVQPLPAPVPPAPAVPPAVKPIQILPVKPNIKVLPVQPLPVEKARPVEAEEVPGPMTLPVPVPAAPEPAAPARQPGS